MYVLRCLVKECKWSFMLHLTQRLMQALSSCYWLPSSQFPWAASGAARVRGRTLPFHIRGTIYTFEYNCVFLLLAESGWMVMEEGERAKQTPKSCSCTLLLKWSSLSPWCVGCLSSCTSSTTSWVSWNYWTFIWLQAEQIIASTNHHMPLPCLLVHRLVSAMPFLTTYSYFSNITPIKFQLKHLSVTVVLWCKTMH